MTNNMTVKLFSIKRQKDEFGTGKSGCRAEQTTNRQEAFELNTPDEGKRKNNTEAALVVVEDDRASDDALDDRDWVHGVDNRSRVDDGLDDWSVVDNRSVVHNRECLHDWGVVDGNNRSRVDGNSLNDWGMVHNVPVEEVYLRTEALPAGFELCCARPSVRPSAGRNK
uniref:Uncharacterized protein n=1 Tax=Anopheles culicifacies TaxID=139723 RepID=A0A182M971_9DIPT